MTLWEEAQKVLLRFAPQGIAFVLDLVESIQQYVRQKSPEGLFEVLDYETRLELLDPQGHTARLTKHERVKFLQDYVLAFQDYAWGQGNVLADYTCTPGFEADRYREGERWNILISLRETKYRGDVQDFYIERKLTNTFTQAEEWWQIEMQHRTRRAKLEVLFPKKRHCREAWVLERNRNRATHLDAPNFTDLADGRQLLSWETIEPRRFETYTVKWRW